MGKVELNKTLLYNNINKEGDCHLWTGTKDKDGYGLIHCRRNGLASTIGVHRAIMYLSGFDIDNKVVMHSCDTPLCVNPRHLSVSTHADNVRDKIKKNRHAKGSMIGVSKLCEDDVRRILHDARKNIDISKDYNVSAKTISVIKKRQQWSHLEV
jgi:hypothetical protein